MSKIEKAGFLEEVHFNQGLIPQAETDFFLGPMIFNFGPDTFWLRVEAESFGVFFSFTPFNQPIPFEALPRQPRLICLDLATSKINRQSERKIQELSDLLAQKSILIIDVGQNGGVYFHLLGLFGQRALTVLPEIIPPFIFSKITPEVLLSTSQFTI